MASLFTHPVVPLALGVAAGQKYIPFKVLVLGIFLSILPDADVVAFRLGMPYEHMLGHRGFSHSLAFAACVAAVFTALPAFRGMRVRIFLFLFAATISHGVLDAMTSGGLGVGFLIPFSDERYFFPWRPIAVSPLSAAGFFSPRGIAILKTELLWVWLPCFGAAFFIYLRRRVRA